MAEQTNTGSGGGAGGDAGGSGDKGKAAEEEQAERYDEAYLLDHARAYGASSPEMAGALTLESRKTHTEDQVKDLLRRFRKHKVDPLQGTPQAEDAE